MNYELHKICRICLKNDILVSIYSPTFLVRPVEMIEKLNIFKPDDSLPTLLCQSCLYRLLDAFNLKQLAETSEHRLREYLIPTNEIMGSSCSVTNTNQTNPADTDIMYANICDIFDRNVSSNDIEVEAGDVEIDVSSLTRSEAEDTLSEVFVGDNNTHISYSEDFIVDAVDNRGQLSENISTHENGFEQQINNNTNNNKVVTLKSITKSCKRKRGRVLKVPDKCLECGKIFRYSGYLQAHNRIHTGERPFICKYCQRQFKQSSNLLLHQRTHTGERRFQCEICSNFFTTSSNLKEHRLIHLEYREHQCPDCDRRFKSQRELKRHQSIHKMIKDIICDICQKAFTKQCYLTAHLSAVHRGIKSHKCNQCGKVFSSRSNYVCHMRTHTGEKPFQCKYCSWKFNQSSALGRHMKIHLKRGRPEENSALSNEAIKSASNINDHVNYTSLINNFLDDPNLVEGSHQSLNAVHSQHHHNSTIHNYNSCQELGVSGNILNSSYTILDFSTTHQEHNQTSDLY